MRAYLVSVNGVKRYAATQGHVKAQRDDFVERLNVKKKDVVVEEVDVPTSKAELIDTLNDLCAELEEQKQ